MSPSFVKRPLAPALMPLLWLGQAHADKLPTNWNLTAGSEYGQDSSRGSLMSMDYSGSGPGANLNAGLQGTHTDASTAADGTVSTSGAAHLLYGTDRLRGGITFASTRAHDYRQSTQWLGTLESSIDAWKFDVDVATRRTRFENFSATDAASSGVNLPTTGEAQAACVLHDVGYRGNVQYSSQAWTFSGSAAGNRYDPVDCSVSPRLTGTVPRSVSSRLSTAQLSALSGSFSNHGRLRAGGTIGQDTALLRSQFTVGVERVWDRVSVAATLGRATSEFDSAAEDTYDLSGTLPVSTQVSVKLSGGTTLTNSVGAPYVGLYLVIDW